MMASITKPFTSVTTTPFLRPFDIRRDLQAVANLIEIGFADTLDDDGRRYLSQMRAAANTYAGFGWLSMAGYLSNYSMSGFVWEEDGRVVGNLSIIPYLIRARRCFLIANVVVHPDYRRRGIGRALTAKAIEYARNASAPAAWLHVREENANAIKLYESLGFIERARRTTWHGLGEAARPELKADYEIVARQNQHWALQRKWLLRNYPPEVTWNIPLHLNSLRPGPVGALVRIFKDTNIRQWAIQQNRQLAAVASWQSTRERTNSLWLAAPEKTDPAGLQALLMHARHNIHAQRPMALDYPAGQSEAGILAAGFHKHQTLIWMEIKF